MKQKFDFSCEARLENLARVRQFIEEACDKAGIEADVCFAFTLSADEICTNIISHGYTGLPEERIELSLEVRRDHINLSITDYGRSYDPDDATVPDTTADWQQRVPGGLGLFMVKEMMDTVHYVSDAENGNRLTLTRQFEPPERG